MQPLGLLEGNTVVIKFSGHKVFDILDVSLEIYVVEIYVVIIIFLL